MFSRDKYNKILRESAQAIDISDEMFAKAVEEYESLGKWIDENTPLYEISIFPQGSFALGTVVRPVSNEEDYDLDLVCEFKQRYGLTAKQLKCDVVKPLLVRYKKASREIEEKRRCWHVEYDDIPNFHMDVIPAYKYYSGIQITDHNEELNSYDYMGSNPAGYVEWFFGRCARQHARLYENYVRDHKLVVAQADIEKVKRRKVKTPLQRTVQILKRHRDIMFADRDSTLKPISIIITTLAGRLYEEEDTVLEALESILGKTLKFIIDNKKDGQYYIENPSYPGENFADKWNTHPERVNAFLEWLSAAKRDLLAGNLITESRGDVALRMQNCFGAPIAVRVFNQIAQEESSGIKSGTIKMDTRSGNLSDSGSISVPANHHHGA